jgi:hypothetical protein
MNNNFFLLLGSIVFFAGPLACGMSAQESGTKTAVMRTGTATNWTPIPTDKPTSTRTKIPTKTSTSAPTDSLSEKQPTETPSDGRIHLTINEINFSLSLPKGWTKSKEKDTWTKGFDNIGFTAVQSDVPAKDLVDATITASKSKITGYLSEGIFKNDAGLDAYWKSFKMKSNDIDFIGTIFVFHKGEACVEAIFGRPAFEDSKIDTTINQIMATFQIDS